MRPLKSAPIYVQVAETLRARIRDNLYAPGTFIPSARELEVEFGVSNITIRRALEILTREGRLLPRVGVGTQVASRQDGLVEIEITGNFNDWLDSASGIKPPLQAVVLEVTTATCPERVSRILGLKPEEKIWRMKRVRRYQGQPISYFVNYASFELGRKVDPRKMEKGTFVAEFQEACDLTFSGMEQRVRAIMADIDLSRVLEIGFGEPLFFVENVYYDQPGRPVEVSHMYYRGDCYVYKATIQL